MARKYQCEQCDSYNQECELCRKNWRLIEFDDTECELFGKKESVKEFVHDTDEGESVEEAKNTTELQLEPQMNHRQRNGWATAWLAFMFGISLLNIIMCILLLVMSSPENNNIVHVEHMISAGIILTSVILLYKWNIWGLYLFIGMSLFGILTSAFINGKIVGTGGLVGMIAAFNMEAKDGNTFFDNLGLTSKRKRIQRKMQSHYVCHSKSKSA